MDTKGVAATGAALTCVRCGYDLRGRALEEPCPECGLAGHRSALAAGQALCDCPPGWVAVVAAGTGVMFLAYLWPVAALLRVLLVMMDVHVGEEVDVPVTWGLLAVHAAGVVMITWREPGGRRTRAVAGAGGGVGAAGVRAGADTGDAADLGSEALVRYERGGMDRDHT
jgi:hypothetical protein